MMGSEVEGSSSDENVGASPLGADTKLMIEVLKEVGSLISIHLVSLSKSECLIIFLLNEFRRH